jgi:hypothetical protein
MTTLLITGMNGQERFYPAESLLAKGYTVHGPKRRASSSHSEVAQPEWAREFRQRLPASCELPISPLARLGVCPGSQSLSHSNSRTSASKVGCAVLT